MKKAPNIKQNLTRKRNSEETIFSGAETPQKPHTKTKKTIASEKDNACKKKEKPFLKNTEQEMLKNILDLIEERKVNIEKCLPENRQMRRHKKIRRSIHEVQLPTNKNSRKRIKGKERIVKHNTKSFSRTEDL